MDDEALKEYLAQHDEGFRKLADKHREYDQQLEQLSQNPYPNPADQMQETVLKKKKLRLKDRMHLRMTEFRQEATVH